MHATAEPDNSVRYGEFCLRISDDSHRTSSKSVTQQPTKSARQTKQTTQQTTEPDHFLDTDKPEEISQPYTEKPNDIIVPLIAPHNFQSHGETLFHFLLTLSIYFLVLLFYYLLVGCYT